MRIVDARIARLRIPLRVPFKTALRSVDAIDDRVLRLRADDGRTGWGSAAATARITGETHASIVAAWREHLLPAVLGRSLDDGIDALCDAVQSAMVGNTSAKAAVEIALHDLAAQRAERPLWEGLASARTQARETAEPALANDLTISVNAVGTMVAEAEAAIARGFRTLKLKVGTDPELDVARLRALHAVAGSRAALRIDANQGWSVEATVRVMHALEADGLHFELIEQPVPAADIDGMAFIRARIETPLLADESVFSPGDAQRVVDAGAADLINIKLMKTGGLRAAARIASIARANGLGCMVGCMLESPVGVAAAAHFARASGITRVDLDPPALATHDPVRGNVRFDEAAITFHPASGLGIADIAGLDDLPD